MGDASLRPSAIAAARRYRFRPVLRNGQPVWTYTEAHVNYFRNSRDLKSEPTDFDTLTAVAQRLNALQRQFPRTARQVLADLEQDIVDAPAFQRSLSLPALAKAALAAEVLDRAIGYADEMLKAGSGRPVDGQAMYDGHWVRGRVAMRQGNLEQAKQELLESASTTGSPALGSFGPNMTLAKELIDKGERDVVLDFFTRCRAFWKSGQKQLDDWSAVVRGGGTPNFGANLRY